MAKRDVSARLRDESGRFCSYDPENPPDPWGKPWEVEWCYENGYYGEDEWYPVGFDDPDDDPREED
jgi:hypothetical protein